MPYIGKQPANVPVTADDIPNDSITAAKIVDAAITIDDIGPNAVGNSEMADDAVGLNELSATGTTNTSTFLRGDNSWAVPPTTDISGKLSLSGGAMTGAITTNSTFDGVDIATRDAVLTSTTTTANAALPKAGGTMTGNIAHAGAFTIDTVGDISLDSEGAILIKNGGSAIGRISNSSSDMIIKSDTSDKDILFKGNDGGSTITALKLDMSDAGAATFNSYVDLQGNNLYLADSGTAAFGTGEDLKIFHDHANQQNKILSASLPVILGGSVVYLNNGASDENMLKATADGSVELYHNNVKTLETATQGIKVISGSAQSRIDMIDSSGNTDGSIYAHTGKIGFLDDDGNWAYQVNTDAEHIWQINDSEKMRIASSGNVGIGSTNPSAKLTVQTTHTSTDVTTANSNSVLTLGNSGTGNGVYNAIRFSGNQQDMYMMSFNDSSNTTRRLGFFVGSTAGDAVADERLTIKGNGQIGIGRIPAALLHLQDTSPEIRFTYTGNSGYSYIKGGANNDLTFSTGTTTGTERMELTGAGILNQFSSTAIQAGVNTYMYTGSVTTSNSSFYVDVDVGNAGGGNVALVEAIFSHYTVASYGCALMGWYSFYNGAYLSENTISDITSGNGGSWSVSGPANGTMRVTKNAGSYAGGGEWFVKVTTQVR